MPVPGNLFTLPDVPLPKVKSLLNIIARPPQRSPRVQNGRSQTYQSYESAQSETPLSTPAVEEREQHDLGKSFNNSLTSKTLSLAILKKVHRTRIRFYKNQSGIS